MTEKRLAEIFNGVWSKAVGGDNLQGDIVRDIYLAIIRVIREERSKESAVEPAVSTLIDAVKLYNDVLGIVKTFKEIYELRTKAEMDDLKWRIVMLEEAGAKKGKKHA